MSKEQGWESGKQVRALEAQKNSEAKAHHLDSPAKISNGPSLSRTGEFSRMQDFSLLRPELSQVKQDVCPPYTTHFPKTGGDGMGVGRESLGLCLPPGDSASWVGRALGVLC